MSMKKPVPTLVVKPNLMIIRAYYIPFQGQAFVLKPNSI